MKALTARQEGFAVAHAKGATKSDAYRQNYKTDGWSAQAVAESASRLVSLPHMAARIEQLSFRKAEAATAEFDMTVKKLLQTYIEIAFTNPNELSRVEVGACRHCWGAGGEYQWKEREYTKALDDWQRQHHAWDTQPPDRRGDEPRMPEPLGGFGYRFTAAPNPTCGECEGRGLEFVRVMDTTKLSPGALHLYRGVQQTKDGIKILFGDKDKALDSIGRMLGAFDDRLRVDLKGAVASIGLTTKDPQEATAAYERMLTGAS